MGEIVNHSRRRFLQGAAGLTLGFCLPSLGISGETESVTAPGQPFIPNAFLRIGPDNSVTIVAKHLEMGQGTYTGLATLLAEELDADWESIVIEGAPANAERYNNLHWGKVQGTGGSSAMANSWDQFRQAGATGRAMLVAAAARRWSVDPAEVQVQAGVVSHFSGQRATFGELAEAAAAESIPSIVRLKDPRVFRLIGQTVKRWDSSSKINGTAIFTQDVHLPDMLVAVVAHPPRWGGTVKNFDASRAKGVKGVVAVVAIPQGVAVVAKDTWSAKKGRDALSVTWDDSAAFRLGTDELLARFRELAKTPGLVATQIGNFEQAAIGGERALRSLYDFPYLAHAAMEPLNCVIHRTPDGCEVWNGEQMQTVDQGALAQFFGLAPEQVKLNMLYAGGSFGRRASKHSDYLLEAAHIVKALNATVPIKLVWLREDDMGGGYYRPLFHHALEGVLDGEGKLIAWRHRLVGQSILAGSPFAAGVKNGIDRVSVEGAANLPYAIPHLQVELHTPEDIPIPAHWWRSVGSSHTAFSTECFLDELASATGRDPLAWRLELLVNHPRHAETLKLAADKAGWGSPLPPSKEGERRGRGVAVHESFGTVVAQVAEVTVQVDGALKVDRVTCAVDCGTAINPDNIRSQVEGSVAFALSAALYQAVTVKDGRIEQSNFDTFPLLAIYAMPQVEVHIVPSSAPPSGIGEPGVPPLAPAVANAIAAATGKRLRNLPFNTVELAKT